MTFAPTPEQEAIIAAATGSEDNLIISALAGAAKTSTLVLIAQALPDVATLCLAFNKRIAVEMQSRLPRNCAAMTLNSLGHRAWAETLGRRLSVDASKTYRLVLEEIEREQSPKLKSALYENMKVIMDAVDSGKARGYVPNSWSKQKTKPLHDDADFFATLEERLTPEEEDVVRAVTCASLDESFQGTIDFNDQVFLPAIFRAFLPRYPLILIDEAQDLSPLNHALLQKLVKKRLIAVGDECQSIYAFRGAHTSSMAVMRKLFSMKSLQLSVSFRCPRAIVHEAQWRAPHMTYPDWATEGAVMSLPAWSITDLPDNAVIICRNNAPLFAVAMKLIKEGIYPRLANGDVVKTLVKVMKKLAKPATASTRGKELVKQWLDDRLEKTRAKGFARDQADCMHIFLDQTSTVGEAIHLAENLIQSSGRVELMTGHKSKGLEFDNIFILNRDLINLEEQQERNLLYVMQTRAKVSLTYINKEDFTHAEPN